MIGLLAALALAAPPDKAPGVFALEGGNVTDLAVSLDGRLVAGVAGGAVHLLDTEDWSIESSAPCAVTSVDVEWLSDELQWVWAGCTDGSVHALAWDGALGAATTSGEEVVHELGGGEVLGTWVFQGEGRIYALAEAAEGQGLQLHTVDVDQGEVDGGAFPVALLRGGFHDGVVTGTTLVISQGGGEMAHLVLGSEVVVPTVLATGWQAGDLTPSPLGTAYAAAGTAVVEYQPTTSMFAPVATGLDGVDMVVASTIEDDQWLAATTTAGLRVWALDDGVIDPEPLTTFDPGSDLDDAVVARWGYAVAGSAAGLVVLTANPWVSEVAVSPAEATDGDVVTLSFAVDEAADWEVQVGGTAQGTGGDVVASGTLEQAGDVEVSLTVGDAWAEGANPVYLLATRDGLVGHAVAEVVVDNPPDPPSLGASSVGFSDASLILSFAGIEDADLERYDVYVTTTPFEAGDWPTGGPPFDGTDDLETPIALQAAPGEDVSVRIAPLTNGTTYYLAVRATDAGGKEGPMSAVVQGQPRQTYSASELAGDPGGFACAGGGPAGAAAIALAGLLALFRRPRRQASRLPVGQASRLPSRIVAVLLGTLVAGSAHAQEEEVLSPTRGNVELRYGSIDLQPRDTDATFIHDVYGDSGHDLFMLEFGPQLLHILELDVGVGLYRNKAQSVDAGGEQSGLATTLTFYPIQLGATLRVDVLPEQVLVPFARLGVDYLIWNEARETGAGGKDRVSGAKAGWHWGLGADLLLDVFQPGRASLLQAQTGIDDTYVVFEWRRQRIEPGEFLWLENSGPLSFSGDLFTVGLKLDY